MVDALIECAKKVERNRVVVLKIRSALAEVTALDSEVEAARRAVEQHIEWLRTHVRWQDDPPPASGLIDALIVAVRAEQQASRDAALLARKQAFVDTYARCSKAQLLEVMADLDVDMDNLRYESEQWARIDEEQQAEIERLRGELDAIRSAWPFEFDQPEIGKVAEAVANEMHDYQWLIHSVSLVYDSATGGLISKPNTETNVVISVIEDRVQRDVDEGIVEAVEMATDDAKAQLAAAMEALTNLAVSNDFDGQLHCALCHYVGDRMEHAPDCILASREVTE